LYRSRVDLELGIALKVLQQLVFDVVYLDSFALEIPGDEWFGLTVSQASECDRVGSGRLAALVAAVPVHVGEDPAVVELARLVVEYQLWCVLDAQLHLSLASGRLVLGHARVVALVDAGGALELQLRPGAN